MADATEGTDDYQARGAGGACAPGAATTVEVSRA